MNLFDQLNSFKKYDDDIYGYIKNDTSQEIEIQLRKKIASKNYNNYLLEISKHHSIPVMDSEIKRFLKDIPINGLILDIGGCWGWHWRKIDKMRPDVKIVILDFVRENFKHTKIILNNFLGINIFLVHGNALSLDFNDNTFDGVWSSQVTQHIPNYNSVVKEVFRVLKIKGYFSDYILNNAALVRMIYKLFNKPYHLEGYVHDFYYLRRTNYESKKELSRVFKNKLITRFTEIIFSPGIGLPIGGHNNSILGRFDSLLSGTSLFLGLVARQSSFHIRKL